MLAAGEAGAVENGYSVSAGMAFPIVPTDSFGASLGVAAFMWGEDESTASHFGLRGELMGIAGPDFYAVMPKLMGEGRFSAGRVDFLMSVGAELFGTAWRGPNTIFAIFGVSGGVGIGVWVNDWIRLSLRTSITYIPTIAIIDIHAPTTSNRPVFGYINTIFSVDFFTRKKPVEGPLNIEEEYPASDTEEW